MRSLAIFTLTCFPAYCFAAPAPKPGSTRMLVASSNKDGNSDIYIIQPGTGEIKNLTKHRAADTEPVWSPDGKQIAFISDRDGDANVWTMKVDGTNLKQLTKKCGSCSYPRWSPDGPRIAFVSEKTRQTDIYTVDVNTKKLTRFTEGGGSWIAPAWSPDGKKLASTLLKERGACSTFIVDVSDSTTHKLTDTGAGMAWSPDGRRLACLFCSIRTKEFTIYTIGVDGKNKVDLGDATNDPQWSPDGNKLCFSEQVKDYPSRVVVVNVDGTQRRIVTPKHTSGYARWSPDGKSLSYLRQAAMDTPAILVVSDPDGENVKELLSGVESAAEWKPK